MTNMKSSAASSIGAAYTAGCSSGSATPALNSLGSCSKPLVYLIISLWPGSTALTKTVSGPAPSA